MSTRSDTKKTIAHTMVMRSRFFSMMLVPVWVEYMELAIASEMPVPFPECMRMKMMRPMPERNNSTRNMITRGVTLHASFYHRLTMTEYKSISESYRGGNKAFTSHLLGSGDADGLQDRGSDIAERTVFAGELEAPFAEIGQDEGHERCGVSCVRGAIL